MKPYEPSKQFVNTVMQNIGIVKASKKIRHKKLPLHTARILQYAFTSSALIAGVCNAMKLYFTVFSSIACH